MSADKVQLAGEIGRLEAELAKHESVLRESQQAMSSAKGVTNGGGIGLLLGIILLFLFWPLGALLIVAGLLAYFTGKGKEGEAAGKTKAAEAEIAAARGRLAEMRAQLAIA